MHSTIFVGHVFSTEQRHDLRNALQNGVITSPNVSLWYADENPGVGFVLSKITAAIDAAAFCFFEISTQSKPNVFLELGYAMGRKKPCFLLCRSHSKIPSDLQGLERIEYESYHQLTEYLQKNLGKMLPGAIAINKDVLQVIESLGQQVDNDQVRLKDVLRLAKGRGVSETEALLTITELVNAQFLKEMSPDLLLIHGAFHTELMPLAK